MFLASDSLKPKEIKSQNSSVISVHSAAQIPGEAEPSLERAREREKCDSNKEEREKVCLWHKYLRRFAHHREQRVCVEGGPFII